MKYIGAIRREDMESFLGKERYQQYLEKEVEYIELVESPPTKLTTSDGTYRIVYGEMKDG